MKIVKNCLPAIYIFMILLCIVSDSNSKKYNKKRRNMHKKIRHSKGPDSNQIPQQNFAQVPAPVQIQPINQSTSLNSVSQNNPIPQPSQFVNGLSLPGTCESDTNSLAKLFKDPSLKDNPNKDDLLTTQALTMILCAFNYQRNQIDQCLQKISTNNKKSILAVIMRRGDTNMVSQDDMGILNASIAGCSGLETLSGQLINRWLNIMPLIGKFNGTRSLVGFFRRLKRFRRRMLKLKKIR